MNHEFTIVIHGGAEDKTREDLGPEKEAGYRKGLQEALGAGWQVLNNGGTAVEAVEAAIRVMEDNELFNAGKGGALTADYENQFDAAIMDGKTLEAGSVAGVQNVKNPITLARAIMENSKHVTIGSEGAKEFAKKEHLELKSDNYFRTEEKVEEVNKEKRQELQEATKDTVGAVALDKYGNLAAGTSTGGLTNQLNGRIGDSPLIGCGTYANNEAVAISCTGDGESITRGVTAHEVYALLKYKGLPLKEACAQACSIYPENIKKDRNLIALTPTGEIALQYQTKLMFRGYRIGQQEPFVAIWED